MAVLDGAYGEASQALSNRAFNSASILMLIAIFMRYLYSAVLTMSRGESKLAVTIKEGKMTAQEKEHMRHIASLARSASRDMRIGEISMALKAIKEIENSARHALACSLKTVME